MCIRDRSGDNGILKGYLENTFRRLYEEGKVREEKEYALFHTGLFNQYYQPIYAYFVPNVVPDRQKWYLEGFYTDYSLLKIKITDLPPRAAYVENPSDLVFDTKLPVVPQYEHIFDDEENVQRLPSADVYKRQELLLYPRHTRYVQAQQPDGRFP